MATLIFLGVGVGVVCSIIMYGLITGPQAIIKVSGHQYRWLAGGYDLEMGHF